MLDPRFVVENIDTLSDVCLKRGLNVDLHFIVKVYEDYKKCLSEYEHAKMQQGIITKSIRDVGQADDDVIEKSKELKVKIAALNVEMIAKKDVLDSLLLQVPNLLHRDVPIGMNPKVIRQYGECLKLPHDHLEICKKLNLADFETSSMVSGYGFCFLKNQAVILELALIRYAIDFVQKFANFEIVKTPEISKTRFVVGAGFSPKGNESQVFLLDSDDMCLIGTSEITIAGMLSGKIFEPSSLPSRYLGLSSCFRKEAGSYGRACRGLFRLRQFSKVEMFSVSAPECSDKELDFIVSIQESFVSSLGLSYQVCNIGSEDLGAPAYKKIDIEVWMPSRKEYGEVSSASNCTDFQSRRLSIKMKNNNKNIFAHTLNGTAIAIPRILLAILENFYDGKHVNIPSVLIPYTGFDKI